MYSRINNGFIVLIVLFFLHLISMLALYELSRAKAGLRTVRMIEVENLQRREARIALSRITDEVAVRVPHCEVPIIASHLMPTFSLAWWQEHGCALYLKKRHYRYVVENLGEDGCAIINDTLNNQQVTAEYYRITLLAQISNENGVDKIILQSTLAKRSSQRLLCQSASDLHKVTLGLQTVRFLTRF